MKRAWLHATLLCALLLAPVPALAQAPEHIAADAGRKAWTEAGPDAEPAPKTVEVEDVDELVQEALARNPSLDAMRARTRELTEMAQVSSTWSDPRFSVEYMNAPVDSFRIDEAPMSGVQFKLMQRLPEWGWTRASKAVAEREVERSLHDRAEAEARLRLSIESLYWSLALSRQLEGVTEQHIARTGELLRAVRARYEVGRAGQNALLRLEVLEQRLRDDLGDHARMQRTLAAGLARALARDPASTVETPSGVEAIAVEGDLERWVSIAQDSRPELAALREEVQQQTDAAALSRVKTLPEVDVWVSYRLRTVETPNDDGTDFFSAGITIPIPIGSRSTGLRGEAARFAARDGARARLSATLDQIEADLISADAAWRRAFDKAKTYEGRLIPAARAALETTLNDFAVDRAEFATLYEAETDLLELERSYLQATIDTLLQRARVRATTGRVDLGGAS